MEAGAEHPGARTLSTVVGIDLGTTNSALAWAGPRGPVRIQDVPQLVAPGDVQALPTLPSFLYLLDSRVETGPYELPWDASPRIVAGVFAREEGAVTPARQISSAKSWLANSRVDRTAPLLPWATDSDSKLSPVEASARILMHLRDAWNHEHTAKGPGQRLDELEVVLTVPASFDEEARELTADAARVAGFGRFTLLEEPLAALYAWISTHRRSIAGLLDDESLILVCDVGGGTTDFTLVRAHTTQGELAFERVAIGEHLLLGGDNLDLALAVLAEGKLGGAPLTILQRQALRRKCSAAKERLLSDPATDRVAITVLGSGRGVIGGGVTTELTAAEVRHALEEGFLPICAPDDLSTRERRVGLRELGLPYETEPAITRHLGAFLRRSGAATGSGMAHPNVVLFNGGFFAPPAARERVVSVLERWFGSRPTVLENARPESAVAIGAAFYGRLRRTPEASSRLIIRAGSARSYYIGVHERAEAFGAADGGGPPGAATVCILPRGTDEGSRLTLDREFTVMTNRPAAFTLFSSRFRTDALNSYARFSEGDDVTRHAPLVTSLRFGKRSRSVPLPVRLSITFTETGTLELWCESVSTDHRWRLAFNLRAIEADPLDDPVATTEEEGPPAILIGDDRIAAASALLREAFGDGHGARVPETLVGELENALGHDKQSWPVGVIRSLADVLLSLERGRAKGPAHEVRWLNLTGFCMRPGLGSALDTWRVSEIRKVYVAGLAFPRDVQNQVEWVVLWGRVSAGFTAAQQQELAQRISGQLGLGGRKGPRLNLQIERESWRLLASLERLDAGQRARFGDELVARVRRDPRNASLLWSLGRLGARVPLYGPLNAVVSSGAAWRWIEELLGLKQITADVASAIAQIGARTDDPVRDVSDDVVSAAATRLESAGYPELAERLRHPMPVGPSERVRVFGESLPEGLLLSSTPVGSS